MEFVLSIGGKPTPTAQSFAVINPATGEEAAQCPHGTVDTLEQAVAAARAAFPGWAATSDAERVAALLKIADLIDANAKELSQLITLEQGKTQSGPGANFEVERAAGWTRTTAELSLAPEVLIDNDDERIELHREPIGVVAAITPWNWPLMIAIWHIMPALRAGCSVVIKPSPFTPLATLKLVELINYAGILPPGVLNSVTGDAEVGDRISAHPDIDKITFTGSIPTGRRIMERAGATLKKLTLELGGNDAGIILPDTDMNDKIEALFWGSFINAGQTCSCLKRLYIHVDDMDRIGKMLADFAAAIPVGNGADEGMLIGPLSNEMQFNKVASMVEDAKARGAVALTGGAAPDGPGYFYPLTVLSNCTADMDVVKDEQFGPVVPIIAYRTVEEAVEAANALEVGLGASVWGNDREEAAQIALRLQAGTRWVNRHALLNPTVPMGGVKQSGIGVEFSNEGLHEYTNVQVLSIAK